MYKRKREKQEGYSVSSNNIMMRLQKFEFHRSQITLCARNRCKRGCHKKGSIRKMNEKKREKKKQKNKKKLDLSYLSYFVIVFVFCDHFFLLSFVSSLYRKSKSGLLATSGHFVNFFFRFEKPLFSFSPTHLAAFPKRKISISLCIPLSIDIKMFYVTIGTIRLLSNRMEMKPMKMEYAIAILVIGQSKRK